MTKAKEEWRAVRGYKGRYEVSDKGRVRSLARIIVRSDGMRISWPERILKPGLTNGFHFGVVLSRDAIKKNRYVHDLVARAFIGPRPKGKEVAHDDGNSLNNKRENLRYDTHGGNQQDRIRHGTNRSGASNPNAKLTAAKAKRIKAANGTLRQIANEFNVCVATVGNIRAGRNWKGL